MKEWMWCKSMECVVQVLSVGHYPDTFIVKMPNEHETEVYAKDLTNDEVQIHKKA